jgi:hypothetical protein
MSLSEKIRKKRIDFITEYKKAPRFLIVDPVTYKKIQNSPECANFLSNLGSKPEILFMEMIICIPVRFDKCNQLIEVR